MRYQPHRTGACGQAAVRLRADPGTRSGRGSRPTDDLSGILRAQSDKIRGPSSAAGPGAERGVAEAGVRARRSVREAHGRTGLRAGVRRAPGGRIGVGGAAR